MTKTNEEIAKGVVQGIIHDRGCVDVITDRAIYNTAMTMAELKDKQFVKQKQQLIDKACGWTNVFLNSHYIIRYKDNCEPDKSWIIEVFKRIMK